MERVISAGEETGHHNREGHLGGEGASPKTFSAGNCILDTLLMLVNSVGIFGSLLQSLGVPWRKIGENGIPTGAEGLDYRLFWGGILLFCLLSVLLRSGRSGKKALLRIAVCGILLVTAGILFRKELAGGFSLALENMVENLNERYQFHIARNTARLQEALEWGTGTRTLAMTGSILYVVFFLELLAGAVGRYDKGFCLIAGNALWFTAACICDVFPGFSMLAICVLGAVGTLVRKDFVRHPGMGFGVVCCAGMLTGLVMTVTFRFFLPVMDEKYEELQEWRTEFYNVVNEEWIPWVKGILPSGGWGSGPDVSGELNRNRLFTYTSEDVYRVTVDRKPEGALYLKGFVGFNYGNAEWESQPEEALEEYYLSQGMELPGEYNNLVNISYEAARQLQHNEAPGHIQIRELGGRGSYSIYPYGAQLSQEYSVNSDGTVERRGREYGFLYYFLAGIGKGERLPEDWARRERQYRRYAYSHYVDYPEERLPRMTECLEGADIRTDNVYVCALDLIYLLDSRADYNLDAENNPEGTDFVEYFLLDSHEGYCVHFATAAVLAFRYFGIPARYVAGYTVSPSDFSQDDSGTYTAVVKGRQAHAWAEIYVDSIGWVPVEMTPGAVAFPEDNRMEQVGQLGQLAGQGLMLAANEELWEQDGTAWQNQEQEEEPAAEDSVRIEVMDSEAGLSGDGLGQEAENGEGSGDTVNTGGEGSIPLTRRWGFRIGMSLLATCMLLAALVCLEKWDESRCREIYRKADRRERIFLLYRNLRNAFRVIGIEREMEADGEAFRRLLQDSFQVGSREYEEFCRILEKNSFGKELPSEEEFKTVCSLCDRLEREAYARAAFYKKPLIRRYRCISL